MSFYLGNTKITITFLFCALLGFLIAFDRHYVFYAFLSVCAHESAHILAMKACKMRIDAVALEPFGVIVKKRERAESLSRCLAVTAAGCVANFVLAAIFFFLYKIFGRIIFSELWAVNISIFLINALPVIGLDGGQAVYEILKWKKSKEIAAKTIKILSYCVTAVLFFIGTIICFKVRLNPSFCLFSVFLFIQTALSSMNKD